MTKIKSLLYIFSLIILFSASSCSNSSDPISVDDRIKELVHNGTIVIEVKNPATNRVWMDRNLGASRVPLAFNDEAGYGDLYQWGRLTDGHEKRTSSVIESKSTTDVPGHSYFIKIKSPANQNNLPDWRTPPNDLLWQGVNGINNPCPIGFRIPTVEEWANEIASWRSRDQNGAFASPLKLPSAGDRELFSGDVDYRSTSGTYWAIDISTSQSPYLSFTSDGVGVGSGFISNLRAMGRSVRCIKN